LKARDGKRLFLNSVHEASHALLGDSDADTTTIYAERDRELPRQAMERLG